jgi:5-methylcytosine-specific restriction endonuclease McrA
VSFTVSGQRFTNMELNIPAFVHEVPTEYELYQTYSVRIPLIQRLYERARLRTILCERQNHKCCYCGRVMNEVPNSKLKSTIEHVIPESRGGATDVWNCVAACSRCNGKRGDTFIAEECLVVTK